MIRLDSRNVRTWDLRSYAGSAETAIFALKVGEIKVQFGSVFNDLGVISHHFSRRNTRKRVKLTKSSEIVTLSPVIFAKMRQKCDRVRQNSKIWL